MIYFLSIHKPDPWLNFERRSTLPKPRAAQFAGIQQQESGSITSIPPGHYRHQFQLGTDWLTERRFCRLSGSSEFVDTFDYAGGQIG